MISRTTTSLVTLVDPIVVIRHTDSLPEAHSPSVDQMTYR